MGKTLSVDCSAGTACTGRNGTNQARHVHVPRNVATRHWLPVAKRQRVAARELSRWGPLAVVACRAVPRKFVRLASRAPPLLRDPERRSRRGGY